MNCQMPFAAARESAFGFRQTGFRGPYQVERNALFLKYLLAIWRYRPERLNPVSIVERPRPETKKVMYWKTGGATEKSKS